LEHLNFLVTIIKLELRVFRKSKTYLNYNSFKNVTQCEDKLEI